MAKKKLYLYQELEEPKKLLLAAIEAFFALRLEGDPEENYSYMLNDLKARLYSKWWQIEQELKISVQEPLPKKPTEEEKAYQELEMKQLKQVGHILDLLNKGYGKTKKAYHSYDHMLRSYEQSKKAAGKRKGDS